jgi:hypothetical protein
VQSNTPEGEQLISLGLVAVITPNSCPIEEWLEFHRKVGVSAFYLYEMSELSLFPQVNTTSDVTVIPWNSFFPPNNQILAYAHAVSNFGGSVSHLGFIDLDEYLVPQFESKVTDVIAKHPLAGGFKVRWQCFSDNGLITRNASDSIIENFIYAADIENADPQMRFELTRTKQIVRCSAIKNVGVHESEVENENVECSDSLKLNHYLFTSELEFQKKVQEMSREKNPDFESWTRKRLEMREFIRQNCKLETRARDLWESGR